MKWPVCNVHGFNNLCIFVRRHKLCFLLVLLELTFVPRSLTSYPFFVFFEILRYILFIYLHLLIPVDNKIK